MSFTVNADDIDRLRAEALVEVNATPLELVRAWATGKAMALDADDERLRVGRRDDAAEGAAERMALASGTRLPTQLLVEVPLDVLAELCAADRAQRRRG